VLLGISENFLKAFRATRGWADIVFFVLILVVILGRSIRGKRA
jgi:branched-subunit amino acid ABC-type transport system permease component